MEPGGEEVDWFPLWRRGFTLFTCVAVETRGACASSVDGVAGTAVDTAAGLITAVTIETRDAHFKQGKKNSVAMTVMLNVVMFLVFLASRQPTICTETFHVFFSCLQRRSRNVLLTPKLHLNLFKLCANKMFLSLTHEMMMKWSSVCDLSTSRMSDYNCWKHSTKLISQTNRFLSVGTWWLTCEVCLCSFSFVKTNVRTLWRKIKG